MVSRTHIVSWLLFFVIIQLEAWQCNDKSTPYNDDGDGDMVFLDRHRLRCYSKGMVRFQLDLKLNEMKYEYFCCKLPKKTTQYSFKTAFSYDGNGHVGYLDRQTVNCGKKAVIGGFNLERDLSLTYVRYKVICRKFVGVKFMNCYSTATTWHYEDGGDVRSLSKHNVKCASGYFVNKFVLDRNVAKQIRYQYRCCKP